MEQAIKVYKEHIEWLHHQRREDLKTITDQAKRIGMLEQTIDSMANGLKHLPRFSEFYKDLDNAKNSTSTN